MKQLTYLDKINILAVHAKKNINLCAAAYQIIEKASKEEQPVLMEAFIRGYKRSRLSGIIDIPIVFENATRMAYQKKYQAIIDDFIDSLFIRWLDKENFYIELTNYIMTDSQLMDDGARAFAIFYCCIDRHFPYSYCNLTLGGEDLEDSLTLWDRMNDDISRKEASLFAVKRNRR